LRSSAEAVERQLAEAARRQLTALTVDRVDRSLKWLFCRNKKPGGDFMV
jgi:hypothetical protein